MEEEGMKFRIHEVLVYFDMPLVVTLWSVTKKLFYICIVVDDTTGEGWGFQIDEKTIEKLKYTKTCLRKTIEEIPFNEWFHFTNLDEQTNKYTVRTDKVPEEFLPEYDCYINY